MDRLKTLWRQRTCWRRITDRKPTWVGVGILLIVVALVLAALCGVAGQTNECVRTDGASLASLVLLVLSGVTFLAVSVFACAAPHTDQIRDREIVENAESHESLAQMLHQRSCRHRITDEKPWWVGAGLVLFVLTLGLAALLGSVGQSKPCIKTDGAAQASVAFLVVAGVLTFLVSLFACFAANTKKQLEQEMVAAVQGHSVEMT